ncbi:MAG: major facilitator superfamily 1 [Gemmatimonadetes bacterium]|nr:major facilitator superfamily 1 [Gemmatimonadota bacterium]
MAVPDVGTVESSAPPGFGYRWTICALIFFATTINYVDRGVIGLLAPTLQSELHWSEADYASTAQWFTFAYAIGFLGAGRFLDRVGVKKGYASAIVWWSLAAMSTALATTLPGFYAARAALGLGESGNFPSAIKATAEWFPKKERAFATGIFNAGTNVGAVITPIMVPYITLNWGWRWAFVVTGGLGFLWLIVWLIVYRTPEQHPKLSAAELAYIRSDPIERVTPVSYFRILGHRQTWAFILGKMITDPVWWFYLFWLPKFLDTRFGVKLGTVAAPIIVIYVVADFGSVGGGWMSSFFIKRGASVNRGRKLAMLMAALAIVPTMLAPSAPSLWSAVAVVSVAAAMHQWWSCNLFTLSSDLFPRRAVATVVGLGGFAGAMGGVGFQKLTGKILQADPTAYGRIFVFCGLAYVTALAIIHLLAPRMEPARLDGEAG